MTAYAGSLVPRQGTSQMDQHGLVPSLTAALFDDEATFLMPGNQPLGGLCGPVPDHDQTTSPRNDTLFDHQ